MRSFLFPFLALLVALAPLTQAMPSDPHAAARPAVAYFAATDAYAAVVTDTCTLPEGFAAPPLQGGAAGADGGTVDVPLSPEAILHISVPDLEAWGAPLPCCMCGAFRTNDVWGSIRDCANGTTPCCFAWRAPCCCYAVIDPVGGLVQCKCASRTTTCPS